MKLYTLLLFIFLVYVHAEAAIFTVFNKATVPIIVEQMWHSEDAEIKLEPGESFTFNTGLANVSKMRWIEPVLVKKGNMPPFYKSFETPVRLGFLNIGGTFEIFNDGAFSYYFGIDGSGKGIAR